MAMARAGAQASRLPRHKPDPVPRLHPLPEYLAEGARKAIYEDTKAVLQVPWMGVVTMAFAHYPTFYATLWQGLRPLCGSAAFVAACASVRHDAELAAGRLQPTPLAGHLAQIGYAPRELEAIGAELEIFSHGNMPYVLIATLARLLLEGEALSGTTAATPHASVHGPAAGQGLVLMERHHADGPTRALYDDIQATLGLPFVNTDYRALARWPSYFAAAWGDLRERVSTAGYEAGVAGVHDSVVAEARSLPNPGGLVPEALQAAAAADASLEEVLAVVRLFQWLLPGLLVNVAFFREQLPQPGGAPA